MTSAPARAARRGAEGDSAPRRRAALGGRGPSRRWGFWAFALPALVLLLLTRIAPEAFSLVRSLFESRPALLGGDSFIGLGNYAALAADPAFARVLGQTLLLVLVVTPLMIGGSLALACLVRLPFRGRGLVRTLVLLPSFIPLVGVSVLFASVFTPTASGGLNAVLVGLGGTAQGFLNDSSQAMGVIGLLLLWSGVGYWMIFFVSGMDDIPEEIHEAASLDGAGPWRRFVSITLPLLTRPVLFVGVANTVWLFEVYAPMRYLTRGGPNGSTETLIYDIVRTATERNDEPWAMTKMVVLLLILIAGVALQFRFLRDRERPGRGAGAA